ncbi:MULTISPECIES: hypothetical protein [Enterobacteriaceae]|uniref:hypothetical protein n=1 Tax=Enterobacteriaceae TaxID=543 RepID=UPI0019336012|nr:hypothetical protein [Atlantibacter hermannii]MBL7638099.1 hypothetical protein [Atlantibacter hermannii]MBL7672983.1 hypothetical protein [Atlantibacter hermannii]
MTLSAPGQAYSGFGFIHKREHVCNLRILLAVYIKHFHSGCEMISFPEDRNLSMTTLSLDTVHRIEETAAAPIVDGNPNPTSEQVRQPLREQVAA